jgi:hypothetical protein
MNFFKNPEDFDMLTCQSIFDITIKVFHFVLDQKARKLCNFCPESVLFATTLGLALMLRLLKGPHATYVDQKQGAKVYHDIVAFMKAVSIEHGDKPTKVVTFAEQMWNSHKAFKNADGSFDLNLRTKSKLAASIVADATFRWREEYLTPDRPPQRANGMHCVCYTQA